MSIPEGRDLSILPDKISFWDSAVDVEPEIIEEPVTKEVEKKLYLKFDTTNKTLETKIKKILANYPGNEQVVIKCEKTSKVLSYSFKIGVNNYLLNELAGIIKSEYIIYR